MGYFRKVVRRLAPYVVRGGSARPLTMSSSQEKPVETAIREKITHEFQPIYLDVINESYMHNVPKGAEKHFKVIVVSSKFQNHPLIKRHRMVNETLRDELQGPVHALSIVAKTPEQWDQSDKNIGKSPPCQGGAGL